jgi:hypothetical protein
MDRSESAGKENEREQNGLYQQKALKKQPL